MTDASIETAFREEWPRILATLIRYTGSVELAEDATAEAFRRALDTRDRGALLNPAAWITTVAKRIAVDGMRRDAALRHRLPVLAEPAAARDEDPQDAFLPERESPAGDDRLGLLFVACSPELAPETRFALALRFVCGIPTAEIAAVMLVAHPTMSARLTRAKREIESRGIRFPTPGDAELDGRLDDVLVVVHLMYTVGHTAFAGEQLGSRGVASIALELARALRRLAPHNPEVAGLLALLLVTDARSGGRIDERGEVVPLERADRALWNREQIDEGLTLAAEALPGGGRFALEAGISELHSEADSWGTTEWTAILALYERLLDRWPSPTARIARLVAVSYGVDERTALAELDALEPQPSAAVERQALALRADLLRRLGRNHEARAAYRLARAREENGAVRAFFDARLEELGN